MARKLDVHLMAQVGVTLCAKCRLTPAAPDRASRPDPRAGGFAFGTPVSQPESPRASSPLCEGAFFFPKTGVRGGMCSGETNTPLKESC
jgi:hypothetical protein